MRPQTQQAAKAMTPSGVVREGLSIKVVSGSLGLSAAITFVFCVVYGMIAPPSLHSASLLEMVLPGFEWLTPGSFVLGLAETFLYGSYAGLVFSLVYNFVSRRCAVQPS